LELRRVFKKEIRRKVGGGIIRLVLHAGGDASIGVYHAFCILLLAVPVALRMMVLRLLYGFFSAMSLALRLQIFSVFLYHKMNSG
jgi:hypothetical protein